MTKAINSAPPEVVVVGGGFGGLEVCKRLARANRRGQLRLTLIDKENFFQFNPLLPDVATGAVETRHIVYPLRAFCVQNRVRFLRNKLRSVDEKARVLELHNGLRLSYDYLVIAAGSSTNYFGIPGAEEHSFPFKTVMDAIRLRAHVVEMWELADQAQDEAARRQLLTFVVAGGGITGVEVCSELLHMFRTTMAKLYKNIPQSLVSVQLVEAGVRLLPPGIREVHSQVAERHLRGLGVNIVLNRKVVGVEQGRILLDDGGVIPAHTLIWTTGIRGMALEKLWPWPLGRGGKLKVDSGTRLGERAFAIGDIADCQDETGRAVPAVAQGAMQMGRVAAANILADLGLGPPRTIRYVDVGYIVGLGKHSTVANLMGIPVAGWVAWYFWALAYLIKMVGIRRQFEVALDFIKGLFVDHDTSQIHERRRMLRPHDMNPVLGQAPAAPPVPTEAVVLPPGSP